MSKIDEQIKELLRKKAKIELLYSINDFVASIDDSKEEHEGLTTEVGFLINNFIREQVDLIQNGTPTVETPKITEGKVEPPKRTLEKPSLELKEFVLKYGHLGFKKVTAKTVDGDSVQGKVVKQEYPYLLVDTGTGLIAVEPETAQVIQ